MPSQLLVIVDDSVTNLKIIERLALSLGGGAAAKTFSDVDAALEFCTQYRPDLVLLAAVTASGEAADMMTRLRGIDEVVAPLDAQSVYLEIPNPLRLDRR